MILLIDDEEDILETIAAELDSNSIVHYEKFINPREVINRLDKNDINVCVVDIGMKELNGVELMDKISIRFPNIGLICVSGFADMFKTRLDEIGVDAIISKPFKKNEISKAIWALEKKLREFQTAPLQLNHNLRFTLPDKNPLSALITIGKNQHVFSIKEISLGGALLFSCSILPHFEINNQYPIEIQLIDNDLVRAKASILKFSKNEEKHFFSISFNEMDRDSKDSNIRFLSKMLKKVS